MESGAITKSSIMIFRVEYTEGTALPHLTVFRSLPFLKEYRRCHPGDAHQAQRGQADGENSCLEDSYQMCVGHQHYQVVQRTRLGIIGGHHTLLAPRWNTDGAY